jgi:hypothetical protein
MKGCVNIMTRRDMDKFFTYNYDYLVAAVGDVMRSSGSISKLKALENKLNSIFGKNSKCLGVLYTHNNGLFFGMSTMPVIPTRARNSILLNDKVDKDSFETYYIEIDSKLLSPLLDLTPHHVTAILLHEIGHIVIDPNVLDEYRKSIDLYCSKNHISLNREDANKAAVLFGFAANDTIKKRFSFFYRDASEIYSDNFASMCGFGEYLITAYDMIMKKAFVINKELKNKLMVLQWVLSVYKEFNTGRVQILRKLNSYKDLTPSVLEKKSVDQCVNLMGSQIDDSFNESAIYESNLKGIFEKIQRSGVRAMENELYELKIQVKSVNTRDDCLYVLRLINNRLGIVEEYLASKDLSEDELARWQGLFTEYSTLRDELTSKKVFNQKMYGLFVDYTKLPDDYQPSYI